MYKSVDLSWSSSFREGYRYHHFPTPGSAFNSKNTWGKEVTAYWKSGLKSKYQLEGRENSADQHFWIDFENTLEEYTDFWRERLVGSNATANLEQHVTENVEMILSITRQKLQFKSGKKSFCEYRTYSICCFPEKYSCLMMSYDGLFMSCCSGCRGLTCQVGKHPTAICSLPPVGWRRESRKGK